MQIKDCLGICNAKLVFGNELELLNHFNTDSRIVKKGDTYVAMIGEVFNGNDYYLDAFDHGAKTCIVSKFDENTFDKEKYQDRNIILVNDTLDFLMELAKKRRENLSIPIIAVTGSVGKTSTKNMIADVLSAKYKVFKTSGNYNSRLGLSLMLLSITDEEIAVLEMGMNELGEISLLSNIAKPNIAVITNIGTAHIGNLGSRENILKAKLEILEGLTGPIIINNDNDLLNSWKDTANIKNKIITYGIENHSDYNATDINYNKNGSEFSIKNNHFNIPVIGRHFIYNSIVAYIIGTYFKIEAKDIANKLKEVTIEPGRMELINKNNMTIINDTYNASFDSIYYALDVLSKFDGRKIAILGDILELGSYAEEIHRKIGKLIIDNKIDILITVGKLANDINLEAESLGYKKENSYHFNTNEEVIKWMNENKKENDIILVKASHGMNFIEIVEKIRR